MHPTPWFEQDCPLADTYGAANLLSAASSFHWSVFEIKPERYGGFEGRAYLFAV
jgi:hypothetical protein